MYNLPYLYNECPKSKSVERMKQGQKENGIVIAVKKLGDMQMDDKQFLNEVKLVMGISHPNIVRAEGYCHQTEGKLMPFNGSSVWVENVYRILCFEYLPHGLEKHISDEFSGLDWHVRYNIILGICQGLYFLHEGRPGAPILHLDLKPANVLLDKHMIPKIADFGQSRLFGEGNTHCCTVNIVGTRPYMAPEYIERGMLKKESDIYSLGVVLMEILTGHRKYPEDTTIQEFCEVKDKWRKRLQSTLNKTSLEEECRQINLCIQIALKCMERDPKQRLDIKEIVDILSPPQYINSVSVQENRSDVEEQSWEVVPLEWREALDIVALRSPEQSIKGMEIIFHELLRIFETESIVPQYIIKDADRLVSYLSAMAEKTSRLILSGATSMSLVYIAGKYTINTLTQAFHIRDLANAVKAGTLGTLLRDLLIWCTVNKDGELSKCIKTLLLKIQENAERISMLLVSINLLRPLDPARWPSCATPVPLGETNRIYSQLVAECLDVVAKNFPETIGEFDFDRILSSIQNYLEELGVDEIKKREETKDNGLVAVMDVLAELVHIRGPLVKDHHSMVCVDAGRPPIILAYIDSFLKTMHDEGGISSTNQKIEGGTEGHYKPVSYKASSAHLKEVSSGSKSPDKMTLKLQPDEPLYFLKKITNDIAAPPAMTSGFKSKEKITRSPELPTELPYDFLKKITNDFAKDQQISGTPFGTLFKGTMEDGRVIAVQKLQENAPMPADKTFRKVLQNVMALKHENIVQILGYCSETSIKLVQFDKRYIQTDITESLICYEYLPKGSLKDDLFGTKASRFVSMKEDWDRRFKIIKGICQGLHFLHTLDIPIIHVDIKPENILLDANMVPKITGFELSRVFGQEQTRLCTQTVLGSYGYMAPEYLYRGEISAQTDIYSLGLMILEITIREQNCRENKQPSARIFIENVQKNWTQEHITSKYYSIGAAGLMQIKECFLIGMECVNIDRKLRPTIETIIDRLNGVRPVVQRRSREVRR